MVRKVVTLSSQIFNYLNKITFPELAVTEKVASVLGCDSGHTTSVQLKYARPTSSCGPRLSLLNCAQAGRQSCLGRHQ